MYPPQTCFLRNQARSDPEAQTQLGLSTVDHAPELWSVSSIVETEFRYISLQVHCSFGLSKQVFSQPNMNNYPAHNPKPSFGLLGLFYACLGRSKVRSVNPWSFKANRNKRHRADQTKGRIHSTRQRTNTYVSK